MSNNVRALPLSGVRILDLSKLLPGPWCTMMLGDLGADVIKIENPNGGDNSRAAWPRYRSGEASESVYFCSVNRNKRSVVVDLKSTEGLKTFHDMAIGADVIVESFLPGVADRLGVGYETVRAYNPDIIFCAVSGFGQSGPNSKLAGHDLNIAGMSGVLQLDAMQVPSMPNAQMGDFAGAAMALSAILAALVERERNGRGAYLDVAMLDSLVSWTTIPTTGVFARTVDPNQQTQVEGVGANPRYNTYRTKDGRYVTVSLLEKRYWDSFCRRYGRPDLVNDAETEADRLSDHGERGKAYREFLVDLFLQKERDAWVKEAHAAGFPVCPVLTPEEVYRSSAVADRQWFRDVDIPQLQLRVPQHGFPFRMTLSDGTNGFTVRHPPPALGEADEEKIRWIKEKGLLK